MSDTFSLIPIERLCRWILQEDRQGRIFGMCRDLFFRPSDEQPFRTNRYGRTLETPVGTAAGPHTQLSQNIITAWLGGARFFELKTIQVLDELAVTKPCIDMEDEGYNCEWSQELTLAQSFGQYLDAWILLHLLKRRLYSDSGGEPGFIFNMSVGYDLAGILSKNVQRFMDRMTDCRGEKEKKIEALRRIYPRIKYIDIPDSISDNVTLSTMHGCPPEEIEKIGLYLIEERRFHTTIKLNPTLLGPEILRDILNRQLGFEVDIPEEAFEHDLKYEDAITLIRNLQHKAQINNVCFSLKLTNTLECLNRLAALPEREKVIYMSGRALHPLGVNLAYRLQRDFDGKLDLSFAGGADCFNIADLVAGGLQPVTVCSDLLKPGGYGRLPQYLEELERAMAPEDCRDIEQFILARAGFSGTEPVTPENICRAALANLENYAAGVSANRLYRKEFFPEKSIKTNRKLHYFDCIKAPCVTTCPTEQGVPDYMYYTAEGDFQQAMKVVLEQNPLPAVTGMVCDHLCQGRCTRLSYDNPLQIRSIKRFIEAFRPQEEAFSTLPKNGRSTAIIGAGPSGLSCAYFLARAGFDVDIFETKNFAGGMAADVIPPFRIRPEEIRRDVERIRRMGVRFHLDRRVDNNLFEQLRREHDYIYLAVGARQDKRLHIKGETARGVMGALSFLSSLRLDQRIDIGHKVAVIGGGNSAVDAARTAWRLVGEEGRVTIVYRRTRLEMPADKEELQAVQAEGVDILELAAPQEIRSRDNHLQVICSRMKLGEPDESGRRRPLRIAGSQFELAVDTVISAVGQEVVLDFLPPTDLNPDPGTGATSLENVWIGGDAGRGPASVIWAIADGKRAARQMIRAVGSRNLELTGAIKKDAGYAEFQKKASRRIFGEEPPELTVSQRYNFDMVIKDFSKEAAVKEASRCLYCSDICNICVTVCPNRANISYTVKPALYRLQRVVREAGKITLEPAETFRLEQTYQVFNIADFCNECGNCQTFCPTSGAPYLDKPRLYLGEESFKNGGDGFFIGRQAEGLFIRSRRRDHIETLILGGEGLIYDTADFSLVLGKENLAVLDVTLKSAEVKEILLRPAAEMKVILTAVTTACPYLFTAEILKGAADA